MKRKPNPIVPAKAKRMVHEYQRMGYGIVPTRDKCLIRMEIMDVDKAQPGALNPIFILSYTSEGKVHPLAGVSLYNRPEPT